MHDYKKFDRSYILLTPESGGYAVAGQKLSGTAILEIRNGKGMATVNIQGVKQPGASVYKLYLICSKDSGATGVCLGEFIPDSRGKVNKIWDFDPMSVGGSGLGYVDFNVIAVIVKNAEQTNEIIAPLVGYKNGVVIWKSGFKEYQRGDVRRAQIEMPIDERFEPGEPHKDDTAAQAAEATETLEACDNADVLFKELCERLKHVSLSKDFGKPDELHKGLKKAIPAEKYEKLLRIAVTIVDYTCDDELERLLLLLTEALGITPHIPYEERNPLNELFTAVDEYIPGKVKEALSEACGDVLPYIEGEEYKRLAHFLKSAEEFYMLAMQSAELEASADDKCGLEFHKMEDESDKPAEVRSGEAPSAYETYKTKRGENGKVRLQSGLNEDYELREPMPGEEHNTQFNEGIRRFTESRAEALEPPLNEERENRAAAIEESAGSAQKGIHAESGVTSGARMSFDETGINDLFNKREQMYPFHGGHGGHERHDGHDRGHRPHPIPSHPTPPVHPGFPPVVPPVIPIFDIRWVKITQDDIRLLPEKLWKYAGNPFVVRAFRKYGHLILGVSGHGISRKYYFGVPGAYSERDRLMALSLGFTSFLPINGGTPRHGEFGYWIMSV